jgi:hypothetical protein
MSSSNSVPLSSSSGESSSFVTFDRLPSRDTIVTVVRCFPKRLATTACRGAWKEPFWSALYNYSRAPLAWPTECVILTSAMGINFITVSSYLHFCGYEAIMSYQ